MGKTNKKKCKNIDKGDGDNNNNKGNDTECQQQQQHSVIPDISSHLVTFPEQGNNR